MANVLWKVTGKDTSGRRFKKQYGGEKSFSYVGNINLFNGSVFRVVDGRTQLVKRVNQGVVTKRVWPDKWKDKMNVEEYMKGGD